MVAYIYIYIYIYNVVVIKVIRLETLEITDYHTVFEINRVFP